MRAIGVIVLAGGCARPAAPEPVDAPTPASPVAKDEEPVTAPKSIDYAATCKAIAKEIAALGRDYPQLRSFDARKVEDCRIDHEHRCGPPQGRGGWTAGVPKPEPDGIWLHIRLWDPNDAAEATAQINTQPVMPSWWIGERRVTFLLREGEATTSCAEAVMAVLERHGLVVK
jgi:hypothetical protein